jgi:hypothetical protein
MNESPSDGQGFCIIHLQHALSRSQLGLSDQFSCPSSWPILVQRTLAYANSNLD